jgi:hypothetical protein
VPFLIRSEASAVLRSFERLPAWLRWILVVPAALLSWVVVQLPVALLTETGTLPDSWRDPASQLANSVIPPFLLVWVAAVLAPRQPFVVALAVTVLHALFIGVVIGMRLFSPVRFTVPVLWLVATGLISIVTTIMVTLAVHREVRKTPVS